MKDEALTGAVPLRRAPHNAPQSRKDESVYRHVVVAVVRGDAAEHVGDVVEPSQHEVVAEMEPVYVRVRRHVIWVGRSRMRQVSRPSTCASSSRMAKPIQQ